MDRLDPAKNQLLGFEAYRALLREFPERRKDTLFLAHLIPSRTDLPAYRAYRDSVFRLVGEINAEFSEPGLSDAISILYLNDQDVALAAITASELLVRVHRARTTGQRVRREATVEAVLAALPILPFDLDVAPLHASLSAEMLAFGQIIGSHDLLIAATAMANNYAVLTTNVRDFSRVPGLVVREPTW